MTVLRSDIERPLDDLISNEEGMRFQGLAVVLAKQQWPDFIACERHKDLGADAIARASLAADGSGKVLACSVTTTLEKIKDDAEKVKNNFDDITTLVFATPKRVTNTTAEEWAQEIRDDFDYELVVMPREDIITSLMNPSNSALCRTHLGIPVPLGQNVVDTVQQVQEATSEVIAAWSARLSGKPLIELRAVKIDQEAGVQMNCARSSTMIRCSTNSRRSQCTRKRLQPSSTRVHHSRCACIHCRFPHRNEADNGDLAVEYLNASRIPLTKCVGSSGTHVKSCFPGSLCDWRPATALHAAADAIPAMESPTVLATRIDPHASGIRALHVPGTGNRWL
jgi:hypothetical protein